MRNWINLFENSESFILHPALDPSKYQITDSIRGINSWKAYTYLNNNDDVGVGNFDKVGYIMISKTNNTIIPISRSDEHHQGFDLLWEMEDGLDGKKYNIVSEDYIAVWPHGNNYIYKPSDTADWVTVLIKFVAYGGDPDGIMQGAQEMAGKVMRIRDFLAHDGEVRIEPGKLAPIGQDIFDQFQNLARLIRRVDGKDRIQTHPAFLEAVKVSKNLVPFSRHLNYSYADMAKLPELIKKLQKDNKIQTLDEIFFGIDGVKNVIHTQMKKVAAERATGKAPWQLDDMLSIWGDLDLAIDMLGRI